MQPASILPRHDFDFFSQSYPTAYVVALHQATYFAGPFATEGEAEAWMRALRQLGDFSQLTARPVSYWEGELYKVERPAALPGTPDDYDTDQE